MNELLILFALMSQADAHTAQPLTATPSPRLEQIWAKREQWARNLATQNAASEEQRIASEIRLQERTLLLWQKHRDELADDDNRPSTEKSGSAASRSAALKKRAAMQKQRPARQGYREIAKQAALGELAKKRVELDEKIKSCESKIEQLRKTPPIDADEAYQELRRDLTKWPALDVTALSVGDMGKLPSFPVGKLRQVDRALLLEVANALASEKPSTTTPQQIALATKFASRNQIKEGHNVRVIQVIDDREVLATILDVGDQGVTHAPTWWICGIGTENLTDDSTIAVNGVVEVTGTKR